MVMVILGLHPLSLSNGSLETSLDRTVESLHYYLIHLEKRVGRPT